MFRPLEAIIRSRFWYPGEEDGFGWLTVQLLLATQTHLPFQNTRILTWWWPPEAETCRLIIKIPDIICNKLFSNSCLLINLNYYKFVVLDVHTLLFQYISLGISGHKTGQQIFRLYVKNIFHGRVSNSQLNLLCILASFALKMIAYYPSFCALVSQSFFPPCLHLKLCTMYFSSPCVLHNSPIVFSLFILSWLSHKCKYQCNQCLVCQRNT